MTVEMQTTNDQLTKSEYQNPAHVLVASEHAMRNRVSDDDATRPMKAPTKSP